MIMEWGGAQWLIVFYLTLRAMLGLSVWWGFLVIPERPETLRSKFWGARIRDISLVAVLAWGGFFHG